MENTKKIQDKLKNVFNETFKIEVKVEDGGKLPMKARPSDAGYDVYATHDFDLYPGQVIKHPLNVRMKLPQGTWAEITTKSGLGSRGQLVYAGVIDEEYRGVPHVIMTNLKMVQDNLRAANNEPISFKKGDKIAQLIMNPYNPNYFIQEVEEIDTNTSRGEGGFGSTGR